MSIKIDLKIFIFLIIFYITKKIEIYTLLLFFAFIHECAHILAGLLVELKPESISISPCGFSVSFKTSCEDYNKRIKRGNMLSVKKLIIALVGPLTNLLIAIVLLLFSRNVNIDENIIYANLLLFIFNMIPIYPMDGGRILKEIIYLNEGLEKSYLIINKISNICIVILTFGASFLILFYHNLALIFMLIYLWILVIKENKKLENVKKMFKNVENT